MEAFKASSKGKWVVVLYFVATKYHGLVWGHQHSHFKLLFVLLGSSVDLLTPKKHLVCG